MDLDDTDSLVLHEELVPRQKDSFFQKFVCTPGECPHRYSILFLLCYIHGAVMFTIENVGGLSNSIIQVMKLSATQYELLFSFFTWPAIVFCTFGGIFIDRISGTGLGLITAILVSITGELLIVVGAFIDYFEAMLLGRFILGLGNELQLVLMNTYLSIWFARKEINFAISVSLSAARLSGATALIVMQYIYESLSFLSNSNYRLGTTLMIGVLVLLGSLVCGIAIIILDNVPKAFESFEVENAKPVRKRQSFKDIKKLMSLDFWLMITGIGVYIPVVFAFTGIGQSYFIQKYGFQIHEANIANSLVFFGVALITPFLGALVSSIGYKLFWAQFGVVLGFLSHLLYIMCDRDHRAVVYTAGMLYSLSYSTFFISTMSAPGELVNRDQYSTAYGLVKSVQDFFYAIICLITGLIIDFCGYMYLEIFFLTLLLSVFSILSVIVARNQKLNRSNVKCRRQIKKLKNSLSYPDYSYSY